MVKRLKLGNKYYKEEEIKDILRLGSSNRKFKNFKPHGIFADGGAFVPTQEKKKKNRKFKKVD